MAKNFQLAAEFIESADGRLFCCHWRPQAENWSGHCVLVAAPFTEEMNRSRYMVTLLAQTLAEKGIGVVCVDALGTGDSEGDFVQSTWQSMVNAMHVASNVAASAGYRSTSVLGIRLGALVALYAQSLIANLKDFHFWQPLLDGKPMLTQMLRVKMAASLNRAEDKGSTRIFEQQIAAGQPVEVSGYAISPTLFGELNEVNHQKADVPSCPIHWYSILPSADRQPGRADLKIQQSWAQLNKQFVTHSIIGPAFWQAHERTLVPELVAATATQVASR